MNIMGAREAIDKLAKEYFAIGENASETAYREAYAKMESKKDLWQWMSPANYSSFIINTVYFAEKYDGVPRALEVLDNLYPDYATACPYDYPNKSKIHESWARFHVIQGDESMAYDHLKKAAFYLFIDNYSYDGFEYFSFRGFSDYAFNDIKNNTICLAHPSTFNDPMDTILFKWNQYLIDNAEDDIQRRLRLIYQKVYDHIKVRCFVRTDPLPRSTTFGTIPIVKKQRIEDVNPLMWAHYANEHKGFCIKYKLPAEVVRTAEESSLIWTRIGNVDYRHDMLLANLERFTVFDALFAKHDVWSYENEVRLVQYDANSTENYKVISTPEGSIQSIYLGLKCSDENREKMMLVLRNRSIKLYQMEVDPEDAYKLIKKRIL
jgi:hypothetical protein